jgi:hypothetical protein
VRPNVVAVALDTPDDKLLSRNPGTKLDRSRSSLDKKHDL